MDRISYSILIVALFAGLSLAADRPYFQPYGTVQGDSILFRNDDGSSPQLPLIGGFQFFGATRTYLYLNNNGIFSFDAALSTFTPSSLNTVNFPSVAVYWADVDTRPSNGGELYYRMSQNAAQLANVSGWIRAAKSGSTFEGTRMFVATWNNVGYYANRVDKTCTFQAVIIADDNGNTFAVFNYGDMQWTTGDASGGSNGLGGTPAVAGFAKGDGSTYAQIAGSLTSSIINIRSGTNAYINGVAQTGQYLFQISEGVVITNCCSTAAVPVINNAPAVLEYQTTSLSDVPDYNGTVTATLRCQFPTSSQPSTSYTQVIVPTVFSVFGCPVKRTWTAQDNCLRSTSVTQTFVYPEVFSEPLTMTVPADYSFSCSASGTPSTAQTGVATTNRGSSANVTFVDGTWVSTTCSASNNYATSTLNRVWSSVDICEARKYGTQVISVVKPPAVATNTDKCVQPNGIYYCFSVAASTSTPFLTAKDACTGAAQTLNFGNNCKNNLGGTEGCVRNGTLLCLWGDRSNGKTSYSFSYSTPADSCGRVSTFQVTVPIDTSSTCVVPSTNLFPSLTTAPLTTAPLTTSELTTSPLTTSPLTTSPLTTAEMTTSPLTTSELTTSPLTTSPLTTSPLTTMPLTTGLMTPAQYCAVQVFPEGTIGYYCNPRTGGFYMCMQGPFNALSNTFACPAGTGCWCSEGNECSGNGAYSPCTFEPSS